MVKKLIHYKQNEFNPSDEKDKLGKSQMFTNWGFLVDISMKNEQLFSPFMISNFSIDENKIFVTLYDVIQKNNIEEKLDELSSGFWFFKPSVTITLIKLDPYNNEVYRVLYKGCKLKKYHGKNLTYRSNELYQWYLDFTYGRKIILRNEGYTFSYVKENATNSAEIEKKEMEILKNTDKMYDDVISKIESTNKINQFIKDTKIKEVRRAKRDLEKSAVKLYNKSLDNYKFNNSTYDKLEKDIEAKIAELDNNINK